MENKECNSFPSRTEENIPHLYLTKLEVGVRDPRRIANNVIYEKRDLRITRFN